MKDLIAFCAVFLLLMTFPIQYGLNTKNHYTISIVQKHVNNAKEQSRLNGCFTNSIVDDLKDNISGDTGIDKSEIQVVATTIDNRKSRGELLYYKVTIPLTRLIAANQLWGISDADNSGEYILENYAVSEWVQ